MSSASGWFSAAAADMPKRERERDQFLDRLKPGQDFHLDIVTVKIVYVGLEWVPKREAARERERQIERGRKRGRKRGLSN